MGANQKLLRSRPNLPAAETTMREAFKFLYAPTTLCFAAKRSIFFFNATNIHLCSSGTCEERLGKVSLKKLHLVSSFVSIVFVCLVT